MKIKLKNIENNPFRDLEKFPLVEKKIEQLMEIIGSTRFYRNIYARPCPGQDGKFQIAYGHHRIEALRRLKYNSIDIPVDDLSDAEMVQAMVADNMKDYDNEENPIVAVESTRAAKNFLDSELAKYERWEDARINEFINTLFENAGNFGRCRAVNEKTGEMSGAGQTTIVKFLHGAMKQWKIQSCLSLIKDSELFSDEIIKLFSGLNPLNDFKAEIKKINKEREGNGEIVLTKKEVLKLAENLLAQQKEEKDKQPKQTHQRKKSKRAREIIREGANGEEAGLDEKIKNLMDDLLEVNNRANKLSEDIAYMNTRIMEIGIERMENVPLALNSITSFGSVLSAAKKLFTLFGVDFESELYKLQKDGTEVY